jgi:pimeloyl-ACP methyl ester carboxylesterase
MQPLYEHRLELAGFETRALELEGDGPPLILLHGYADSADTWRRTMDLLARHDRRAIAFDLPGFAAAGPLRPGEPVLEQLDAFVAAAVGHVAQEQGADVVLVGNSLGGCVSLRAGERDDLPLRGIVPVAPAGFDMPVWFRVIEADPLVRALLASPLPLPSVVVRAVVGQAYRNLAFARPRAVPAEVVAAFTEHHRSPTAISQYLATGRRLLPELNECFRLARVRMPVLLVWGDRDRMVTHRGSREVLEALPDTEYVLLEGVGHCPQVEAPERFVEVLERFTAGVAA